MNKVFTRILSAVLAAVFAAGIYYYAVYHPAERVVDAYVMRSSAGTRINFIDYYKLSFNVGTVRVPVYLESWHYRFHSLDARTGELLARVELGDSSFLGRSQHGVWFVRKGEAVILDPFTGEECRLEKLPDVRLHQLSFSIGEERAVLTYVDGRTLDVRHAGCRTRSDRGEDSDQPSFVVRPVPLRSLSFGGPGPRKTVSVDGRGLDLELLTPEILRARYFLNRNAADPKDAWHHVQREVKEPFSGPDGEIYIQHRQALNKSTEFVTAISRDGGMLWTVELPLRGSYILPHEYGITVIPDRMPLIFRQTALGVGTDGSIRWRYTY